MHLINKPDTEYTGQVHCGAWLQLTSASVDVWPETTVVGSLFLPYFQAYGRVVDIHGLPFVAGVVCLGAVSTTLLGLLPCG